MVPFYSEERPQSPQPPLLRILDADLTSFPAVGRIVGSSPAIERVQANHSCVRWSRGFRPELIMPAPEGRWMVFS